MFDLVIMYTRNTRIKVVTKKHSKEWIPQVEFRVPLIGLSWWQDFEDSCPIILSGIPWQAYKECVWNKNLEAVDDEQFAKAVIEAYHRILDEKEHKDVVEYVKWPE